MRRRSTLLAAGLAVLSMTTLASAASQASLPDIEDEVMCPICGTLLELSESPQAERQRAFISRRIAAGGSKEEIKQALVAEYGQRVLALPRGSGFDLSAYLVPVLGFVAAALALALGIRRWRRGAGEPGREADAHAPSEADAKRLDDDLARYDL